MFLFRWVYWITRTPAFVWVGLGCIIWWTVSSIPNQCAMYIMHSKEFPGNQGKHQNLGPFVWPYKVGLIFMGTKQKKKSKWPTQKTEFFNSPNSQYIFLKILGIGSWFSRINWYKGHQCGSTYMVVRLSNVSSKKG